MSVLLLDTNIVSYLLKGDSRAYDYAPFLEGHKLAISFVTVAELFEWAAMRRWGAARSNQLEQTLRTYLIIPVDVELCRTWGRVRAEQREIGHVISPQDAWIAATARHYSVPLITHNPRDFQHVAGLEVRTTLSP
ncbi:MAG: type II toxin-antitoxin system VapC family toxin [Anaerolineae bacterium]